MPKISILTPVYIDTSQKVDWLGDTIQSVIDQTEKDWEMILIDDKSPVAYDYIKAKYAGEGRLRWLENSENAGPAMTRNTAAELARSECLLPLDSDDALATNDTLANMYNAWSQDRKKTVYGNVQLYRLNASGVFERSKIYSLAEYTFEVAMNLEFGIMPVTTMHSKDAHFAAGGWKASLKFGREDMEYWIACGKAGYCGLKINHPTLLYRKHEQSRDYKLKFELKELRTVQRQIMDMHSDIYNGRFPVACCGGNKSQSASNQPPSADPAVVSQQNQGVRKVTELPGYDEKDLEWAAYQGPKSGSFSILVRGPANLPSSYHVLGTGHFFQIHKQQRQFFEQRQHLGFRIGQIDPRKKSEEQPQPKARLQPVEAKVTPVPKPELSTLVRLDRAAAQTHQPAVKPVETRRLEPEKPAVKLEDLGMAEAITTYLAGDNWTVERLAAINDLKKLTVYPGVGAKRAQAIIDNAKELINDK